jgi:hypothetical protein
MTCFILHYLFCLQVFLSVADLSTLKLARNQCLVPIMLLILSGDRPSKIANYGYLSRVTPARGWGL